MKRAHIFIYIIESETLFAKFGMCSIFKATLSSVQYWGIPVISLKMWAWNFLSLSNLDIYFSGFKSIADNQKNTVA
jgi:hypothetical protein